MRLLFKSSHETLKWGNKYFFFFKVHGDYYRAIYLVAFLWQFTALSFFLYDSVKVNNAVDVKMMEISNVQKP